MRRFEEEWEQLLTARQWLRERGFRLVASRGPQGMDQGFDLYADGRMGLRMVAD